VTTRRIGGSASEKKQESKENMPSPTKGEKRAKGDKSGVRLQRKAAPAGSKGVGQRVQRQKKKTYKGFAGELKVLFEKGKKRAPKWTPGGPIPLVGGRENS